MQWQVKFTNCTVYFCPTTIYYVSLDYSEEQSGELETLRCIYSEQEFTEISDAPPCFKISVQATDSSDRDKEVTGAYIISLWYYDLIVYWPAYSFVCMLAGSKCGGSVQLSPNISWCPSRDGNCVQLWARAKTLGWNWNISSRAGLMHYAMLKSKYIHNIIIIILYWKLYCILVCYDLYGDVTISELYYKSYGNLCKYGKINTVIISTNGICTYIHSVLQSVGKPEVLFNWVWGRTLRA